MIDERALAPAAMLPTAIEYSEMDDDRADGRSLLGGNLGVVKNISVKLQVKAGETTLSVGELLALREGQVLKLDGQVNAPLQILLEGEVVASGELMAMGEHFAVRIIDTVRRG
ncbi:FliM/FliN family flagellar motor switch protein [Aquabacterium humicola]|uniref:FliM/FliN family flagellar motor switch protein n=1 Tax=Aquabacterium humicola TaxID=3237377 RepID=UPI0025429C50|nr:FliM/FliN family flagellar motor switch protein [Rubrivivax pictus]